MQFSWVYSIAGLLIVIIIFHYTQLLLIQMEKKISSDKEQRKAKKKTKTGTNNRKIGQLPLGLSQLVYYLFRLTPQPIFIGLELGLGSRIRVRVWD